MAKYLNVGSIFHTSGVTKNGDPIFELKLDNNALATLLEIIQAHGEEFLGNLTEEQIQLGQRLKYRDPNRVPRLKFTCMAPTNESVAKFIDKNVSLNLDFPSDKAFDKK